MLSFALNHMTVPGLGYDAVLGLASRLGCVGVEFRNDLAGPLFDGAAPGVVRGAAQAARLRLLALAEVKMFDDWSDRKRAEASALIGTAAACGAEAVGLIPRNDGRAAGKAERQANLRVALRELAPMLKDAGLTGLVEPLGFGTCALRSKAEVVEAIEALGHADRFRLVHDTFHHHLAGGGPVFAAHTGIVHVSGVVGPGLGTGDMRDAHRVLVDGRDRLGNVAQIETLRDAGYRGPVSVEAFAPAVHALTDPGAALRTSFDFIRSCLAARAA